MLTQTNMLRLYGNEADVERSDDDSAYGSDGDVYAYGAGAKQSAATRARASAEREFVYSIDALYLYGGRGSKIRIYMANENVIEDGAGMRFLNKPAPATECILLSDLCKVGEDGFTNVPLNRVVAKGTEGRWVQRGPGPEFNKMADGTTELVNIGGIFIRLLMDEFQSYGASTDIHTAMEDGATKEHTVTLGSAKPVTLPPGIGNQTYRLLEIITSSGTGEPSPYAGAGTAALRVDALRNRGLDYCVPESDQRVVGGRGTARLFRNLVLSAALRVVTE